MRCDDVEVRLDCLRSGELDHAEKAAVEEHVRECTECRELRDEIDALASSARRLMGECRPCCLEALERTVFDRYDRFDSPRGEVHVAFSSDGVKRIRLGGSEESFSHEHQKRFGRALHRSPLEESTRKAIMASLDGQSRSGDEIRIDLSDLPRFERKVLEILLQIPIGEVRTYAWVAREAGSPSASRAVGNACARNPIPFVVPCHRVVPTSGGIGSYGYGTSLKTEILSAEGVATEWLQELSRNGVRYIGSLSDHSYCFPTCRGVEGIAESEMVYLRSDHEAMTKGFEPCDWCRPLARSA